jgi:hypothetical protein
MSGRLLFNLFMSKNNRKYMLFFIWLRFLNLNMIECFSRWIVIFLVTQMTAILKSLPCHNPKYFTNLVAVVHLLWHIRSCPKV